MGIVYLLALVAAISAISSRLILGYIELGVVLSMPFVAILIAILISLFMRGHRNVVYGIFGNDVEDEPAFIIAEMHPTEDVSKEDKSFMLESVIAQGGIPIDSIGMWFFKKGMVRIALKFIVKPGKISDEYRAERAAETANSGESLKASIDAFKNRKK